MHKKHGGSHHPSSASHAPSSPTSRKKLHYAVLNVPRDLAERVVVLAKRERQAQGDLLRSLLEEALARRERRTLSDPPPIVISYEIDARSPFQRRDDEEEKE